MRLKLCSRINHDSQGLELQWKPTAQMVKSRATDSRSNSSDLKSQHTFVRAVEGCKGHGEESGGVFASIY